MTKLPTAIFVDDSQAVANFVRRSLKKHLDMQAYASDAKIGIQLAIEHAPDVVITDIIMPGDDPFEACETIKESVDTKVIFYSAEANEEMQQKAIDAGASGLVEKKETVDELVSAIGLVLKGKEFWPFETSGC